MTDTAPIAVGEAQLDRVVAALQRTHGMQDVREQARAILVEVLAGGLQLKPVAWRYRAPAYSKQLDFWHVTDDFEQADFMQRAALCIVEPLFAGDPLPMPGDAATKPARGCDHRGWSFKEHGRGCPHCGMMLVDPGD